MVDVMAVDSPAQPPVGRTSCTSARDCVAVGGIPLGNLVSCRLLAPHRPPPPLIQRRYASPPPPLDILLDA